MVILLNDSQYTAETSRSIRIYSDIVNKLLSVYLDGLFNNTIYIYASTHTYTHILRYTHSVEPAEISMGKFDNPTSGHDFPRQSN